MIPEAGCITPILNARAVHGNRTGISSLSTTVVRDARYVADRRSAQHFNKIELRRNQAKSGSEFRSNL